MECTSVQKAAAPASAAQLHRFLGTGLVLLAGVFLLLTYLRIAPILPADTVTPVIAYGSSAIAVALMAAALFVLKPRVPACTLGQSVEEFWSTPAMGGQVFMIWFLVEGAGMIAAVGYFLTGQPAAAFVTGLAIAAYWLCGPNLFAKA